MKLWCLAGLLWLCGATATFAQSFLLPSDVNGTVVSLGPRWALGDDGSLTGLALEVAYSAGGRLDAGGRFSTVGGLNPTFHNNRVFTPFLAYALIKQDRGSAHPFTFSLRTEFDILISDAGVYAYEDKEDPDGIARAGFSLSHNLSNWSHPVVPTVTVLYSKTLGYDFESKVCLRTGLAILFPSQSHTQLLLYPQAEKFGDISNVTINFGLLFW